MDIPPVRFHQKCQAGYLGRGHLALHGGIEVQEWDHILTWPLSYTLYWVNNESYWNYSHTHVTNRYYWGHVKWGGCIYIIYPEQSYKVYIARCIFSQYIHVHVQYCTQNLRLVRWCESHSRQLRCFPLGNVYPICLANVTCTCTQLENGQATCVHSMHITCVYVVVHKGISNSMVELQQSN